MEPFVIRNVFAEEDFRWLSRIYNSAEGFYPVNIGGAYLFYKNFPSKYNSHLSKVIEAHTKKKYLDICSFARLNTPDKDFDFRVHVDGKLLNQYSDLACVFYLRTVLDSGTALFEHPIHGRYSNKRDIHIINDGLWKPYYSNPSENNSMFVYPSNHYHGRFPWRSDFNRIVVVKFLKEI